jgi:hypothetical protein
MPPFEGVLPDFFENPGAFYGGLVRFRDLNPRFKSVVGKSGGPLFVVRRLGARWNTGYGEFKADGVESRALIRANSVAPSKPINDVGRFSLHVS